MFKSQAHNQDSKKLRGSRVKQIYISCNLLSLQNFRSKNTKTIEKLIKGPFGRITSTADSNSFQNTLKEIKAKLSL